MINQLCNRYAYSQSAISYDTHGWNQRPSVKSEEHLLLCHRRTKYTITFIYCHRSFGHVYAIYGHAMIDSRSFCWTFQLYKYYVLQELRCIGLCVTLSQKTFSVQAPLFLKGRGYFCEFDNFKYGFQYSQTKIKVRLMSELAGTCNKL